MSGIPAPIDPSALPAPQTGGADASAPRRKGRYSLLTGRDKVTLALMVGIPTILCLSFIWLPTLASILLSFTNWRGITADHRQQHRGLQELRGPLHPVHAVLAGRLPQRHLAALPGLHRDADRHLPRGPPRSRDEGHAGLPERVLHPGRAVAGHRRVHLGADVHVAGVHQQHPRSHRARTPPSTSWGTRRSTSGRSSSRRAGATSAT